MESAVSFLIPFCVFFLILFIGLCFYRIVSGEYVPILCLVTIAVISSLMVIELFGRVPHIFIVTTVIMAVILWKWPGSEVSFIKSVFAVCPILFLLSLLPGIIMGLAAAPAFVLPIIAIILVVTIA